MEACTFLVDRTPDELQAKAYLVPCDSSAIANAHVQQLVAEQHSMSSVCQAMLGVWHFGWLASLFNPVPHSRFPPPTHRTGLPTIPQVGVGCTPKPQLGDRPVAKKTACASLGTQGDSSFVTVLAHAEFVSCWAPPNH